MRRVSVRYGFGIVRFGKFRKMLGEFRFVQANVRQGKEVIFTNH
jgi:hypothetical protein